MESVGLEAFGKINLSLDVLKRRPDGYHELRMIMQTVDLCDRVTISKNQTGCIRISCSKPGLPTDERNLAYKAARLFMDEYGIDAGVDIDIIKCIPEAAGMAGGSADAAAVLKGMDRLFEMGHTAKELASLGLRIGADVPYCVMGGIALAEGIGEVLTPICPMPDCRVVLALPHFGISTKYVYEHLDLTAVNRHPDTDSIIHAIGRGDIAAAAALMVNVLETVSIPAHPEIAYIKEEMLKCGALGSLMSGSGPTVFGIFDDEAAAARCAEHLRADPAVRRVICTRPA